MNPLWSDGIRPERTSDDLPLPEVPTTERKRLEREPAQQIVDLSFAAEEEMIFIRLERPKPRKRITWNTLPPCASSASA